MNRRPLSKTCVFAIGLAVAGLCPTQPGRAQDREGYRIQIARKSESQRRTDARRMTFRGGTLRNVADAFFYRIEVRRMAPDAPEHAALEALVVAERPGGRLLPAGYSREWATFPLGINVAFETDAIELERVEWSGPWGARIGWGPSLHGYVIRIVDEQGKVWLERAQPLSLREEADRLITEWKQQQELQRGPVPRAPVQPRSNRPPDR